MWNLPRPGIEPRCPALAGRFLTTRSPGKPSSLDTVFVYFCGANEVSCRGPFQTTDMMSLAECHLHNIDGARDDHTK